MYVSVANARRYNVTNNNCREFDVTRRLSPVRSRKEASNQIDVLCCAEQLIESLRTDCQLSFVICPSPSFRPKPYSRKTSQAALALRKCAVLKNPVAPSHGKGDMSG